MVTSHPPGPPIPRRGPFAAPDIPPEARAERDSFLAWRTALLAEARSLGIQEYRVSRRQDGGPISTGQTWFVLWENERTRHHLRTVLPSVIAFDLGDHVPWAETRLYAHAIADALHALGLPYHMGLSGGKGIHIEVYLDPAEKTGLDTEGCCANCQHGHPESICPAELLDGARCGCMRHMEPDVPEDWRWHVARTILSVASLLLWGDNDDLRTIAFDPLFIAPNEGSQQLREWGEKKSAGAKVAKWLWHDGHGPAPRLPMERDEAYAMAQKARPNPRPSSIERACGAGRFDTRPLRAVTSSPCPKGPGCVKAMLAGEMDCGECPVGA